MSFSQISMAGPTGLQISIARPSGAPLRRDPLTGALATGSSGWGIDSGGKPYFDCNGASPGEQARLAYDSQGFCMWGPAPSMGAMVARALRRAAPSPPAGLVDVTMAAGVARWDARGGIPVPAAPLVGDPQSAKAARWDSRGGYPAAGVPAAVPSPSDAQAARRQARACTDATQAARALELVTDAVKAQAARRNATSELVALPYDSYLKIQLRNIGR